MRKKIIILFLTMGALMLSGCNTKIGNTTQQTTESSTTTSSSVTETDTSDMFSDRDKEVGYDESESVTISLADNSSSCESDAVSITENTITIKDEGTYILSGSLSDGMVIVEAEDTDKVQIVLNGASISNDQFAALYVRSADKVFVTTASGTENTLEHSGSSYTAIDENNIDAAIFSKSDLTLNGEGTLTVTAQEGHGIVSKDDLVLTSGTYVITSASHGLSGKDSVRIANGTYTISAGDDGIHAASNVTISDGKIDITQSYEGIEGLSIDIAGGEISVLASDDGINAAGGNDSSSSEGFQGGDDQFASTEGAYIQISGGVLHVNASGDGIDSNGDIIVSGGETYVSGPTNDGNGSLDYNGSAQITGGIFAASGSSGMAQNFDSSSTQGTIMVNIDEQEGNTEISLLDSSSTELLSWTAEKQYSSIIISTPEIQQGETYTITAGTAEQSVTMDSLVYGSNAQGEIPGNGGERGDMKGGPGNRQPDADMEKPQRSAPPDAPSGSK